MRQPLQILPRAAGEGDREAVEGARFCRASQQRGTGANLLTPTPSRAPSTASRSPSSAGGGGFASALTAFAAAFCLAAASDPSERLPDPAQEARARELFQEVRCLVCQNESIDDSEAELAADLRRLVRQQVAAGRTDDEVRDHLVQRYGQFVLLKPSGDAANLPLWLAPFALVLIGGGGLYALWRRRRPEEKLSEEEQARLARLSRPET